MVTGFGPQPAAVGTVSPMPRSAHVRDTVAGVAALVAAALFASQALLPFAHLNVLRALACFLLLAASGERSRWLLALPFLAWAVVLLVLPLRLPELELAGTGLLLAWAVRGEHRPPPLLIGSLALAWLWFGVLTFRGRGMSGPIVSGFWLGFAVLLALKAVSFWRRRVPRRASQPPAALTAAPASSTPRHDAVELEVRPANAGLDCFGLDGGELRLGSLEPEPSGPDWKDARIRAELTFPTEADRNRVLTGLAARAGIDAAAPSGGVLRVVIHRFAWRDEGVRLWLGPGLTAMLAVEAGRARLGPFAPDRPTFVRELVARFGGGTLGEVAQQAWAAVQVADAEMRDRDLIEGARDALTEAEAAQLCARAADLGFWPLVELVQLTQDHPKVTRAACERLVAAARQQAFEAQSTEHASVTIALATLGHGAFGQLWSSLELTRTALGGSERSGLNPPTP